MLRNVFFVTFAIAWSATALTAGAAELDAAYLAGTWAIGADCSAADAERMEFQKSGIVTSTSGGKGESAGFWSITEGLIELHVVAQPGFFNEKLEHLKGQYHLFMIWIVPSDLTQDVFKAVGLLGNETRTGEFRRCE